MNEIAKTIYEQINGKALFRMVGATHAAYDTNALMFRFKMCRKYNHVTITLNSMDLYDVRFCKITPDFDIKNDETVENVYADQLLDLFEEKTGLATAMPVVIFR